MSTFRFGPIEGAIIVVVDMQRLFAESTEWQVADLGAIVPACRRLIEHRPDQTVFSVFVTPRRADDAPGHWRTYYRRWRSVTLENMDAAQLDVIEPLIEAAPLAPRLKKSGYSLFESADFLTYLETSRAKAIILAGVETDVCVLSTCLDAVDRGLRVIVATDAVTSSSPFGHKAALDILETRFDQQVEFGTVSEIIAAWGPA